MSANEPTEQSIRQLLAQVTDPESGQPLSSTESIDQVTVCDGHVTVKMVLRSTADPNRDALFSVVRKALTSVDGVKAVDVQISTKTPPAKPAFEPKQSAPAPQSTLPNIKHIIAISSGKGGVGKTTVTVNLACALQQLGHSVGILDADIYGPNVPIMMGLRQAKLAQGDNGKLDLPENHGVKVVSMAFLLKEEQPVVWRGPMLDKVIRQFHTDSQWGDSLDYLLIDLPPGTGDAQLTVMQAMPVSGAIIVTTPQAVALHDSRKGLAMFQNANIPVLGLVENMSYFMGDDGKRYDIFGEGGAHKAADELSIPFLAAIPLLAEQRAKADEGFPVVAYAPDSEQAGLFKALASEVLNQLEKQAPQKVPALAK